MKTVSWVLSLLLTFFLVCAFAQVPTQNSPLPVHLSSRYQQRATMETGISSQTGAVLADYRSMDLFAAVILFSSASLALLFFFPDPPRSFSLKLPAFFLGLGILITLGIGFLGLKGGGDFLDYEALAQWTASAHARSAGALTLLAGTFFSLGGWLMLLVRWVRSPEGSGGR